MRIQEITKSSHGTILVVTWEWRNGWNLVDSRKATQEEIEKFNRETDRGLPVKL